MNKKIKIAYLLLLIGGMVNAQGIEFFHGKYEDALRKANKEKKNIFVDVYTTWCGPCKQMSKNTFTDEQVGKYFNENFVAIKLDAENEADSPFFDKYQAAAFPTLFWLDSKGDILDQYSGYMDPKALIDRTNVALKTNIMADYKAAEKKWNTEKRDFDIYQGYVMKYVNKLNRDQVFPLTVEFFEGLTEEEKLSQEAYGILMMFTRNAEHNILFDTLLKNWKHYMELVNNDPEAWRRMYTALVRQVVIAKNRKDEKALKKHMEFIKGLDWEFQDMFVKSIDLENIIYEKNYDLAINKMFELTEEYNDFPFLYKQYFYSLIISGYFLQEDVNMEQADKLIEFTRRNAKFKATQESMLYMAVAYAHKGDYKTGYEYLASLGFYPKPMLSNAIYRYIKLPNPKQEFPW
ncbi:thioredoxin family protein [Aestuariibaculum sediminum]|uniref:Thioredoxin family protein n=1 Tax=Aestuariibaculum sediminum TaxID=2770637 RepID=A0A8J6UHU9_9FLAO|nr:thioredoxin fold domain-containing protein [Aestuariibaculum sediminum]MBD0833401.1 thioredoxin family protein [Aestuariibaculum sediminum]